MRRAARLDGALPMQSLDVGRGVAELGEQHVGMLADARRPRVNPRGCLREIDGRAQQRGGAGEARVQDGPTSSVVLQLQGPDGAWKTVAQAHSGVGDGFAGDQPFGE